MRYALLVLLIAAAYAQPTIAVSFSDDVGVASGAANFYKDHPDMGGGVSPNYVASLTGQNITVRQRDGTLVEQEATFTFLTAITGQSFTRTQVTDPDMAYWPSSGRWIVMDSHTTTGDWVCVSAGDDPRFSPSNNWKCINASSTGGDLLMRIGFRDDILVWTRDDSSGSSAFLFGLPKADIQWVGAGSIDTTHLFNSGGITITSTTAGLSPAMDFSSGQSAGGKLLVVSRTGTQNSTGLAFDLTPFVISYSAGTWTCNGLTNGTCGTTTPVSSGKTYDGGSNVAVAQPSSTATLRLVASWRLPRIAQSGNTAGFVVPASDATPASRKLFFFTWNVATSAIINSAVLDETASSPAVANWLQGTTFDPAGNLICSHTRASSSLAAGIYATYMDTSGTLHGPSLLLAGVSAYGASSSIIGWGNYPAMVQDTGDPYKVWALQEYADGSISTTGWHTQWIEFQVASVVGGVTMNGGVKFQGKTVIQ